MGCVKFIRSATGQAEISDDGHKGDDHDVRNFQYYFIIKRTGLLRRTEATDRKPPRLQFGRQGKRAMTYYNWRPNALCGRSSHRGRLVLDAAAAAKERSHVKINRERVSVRKQIMINEKT